jgi:hypothetical protein
MGSTEARAIPVPDTERWLADACVHTLFEAQALRAASRPSSSEALTATPHQLQYQRHCA